MYLDPLLGRDPLAKLGILYFYCSPHSPEPSLTSSPSPPPQSLDVRTLSMEAFGDISAVVGMSICSECVYFQSPLINALLPTGRNGWDLGERHSGDRCSGEASPSLCNANFKTVKNYYCCCRRCCCVREEKKGRGREVCHVCMYVSYV